MKASLTRGSIHSARRIINGPGFDGWARNARIIATKMKRANHRLTRRLFKRELDREDGWHRIESRIHSWQIF